MFPKVLKTVGGHYKNLRNQSLYTDLPKVTEFYDIFMKGTTY